MTIRHLKTILLSGAMITALVPLGVAAQNAAQPKAASAPAKVGAAPATTARVAPPGPTAPMLYKGFVPSKNAFGQPDITGAWSNGTTSSLTRQAIYGDRLVMTPEEVAAIEGTRQTQIARANKPTDPSVVDPNATTTCDVPGYSGVNCGYNAGWTDPGDRVMRVHGEPRTSFITYPVNGQPPAPKATATAVVVGPAGEGDDAGPAGRGGGRGSAPAAAAAGGRGGAAAAGGRGGGGGRGGLDPENSPERRGTAERCLTSFGGSAGPIMTDQLYNKNYRIQPGRDSVAIWVEMVHEVRNVRLNSKHPASSMKYWFGDAIGHYEGNTLVVETTNFRPENRIQGRSAEDLVMTERFTRVARDRLLYQFNVHSPANWDVDWGGEYEFAASPGIFEYACHEGNYALEGILTGNLVALGAPLPPAR